MCPSLPPSQFSLYTLQYTSQGSHSKVEAYEGVHAHLSCVTLRRHLQPQSLVIPSLLMSND